MDTSPPKGQHHRILRLHPDEIPELPPSAYVEWQPGQPPGGVPLRVPARDDPIPEQNLEETAVAQ